MTSETSRDLTIRRLNGYWNGAQGYISYYQILTAENVGQQHPIIELPTDWLISHCPLVTTPYCIMELDQHRFSEWLRAISEWLNLTAYQGTADSEVHIVHISCVITAYTLESLSSRTDLVPLGTQLLGWPNSAQNLVTSRFFHDFMPCSTRRHSITCEPILKWKIQHERSCPELSNDTNNMQQMFLLTQIAESFWTQFSAKTPLLTRF